jgi:hypothetical protein
MSRPVHSFTRQSQSFLGMRSTIGSADQYVGAPAGAGKNKLVDSLRPPMQFSETLSEPAFPVKRPTAKAAPNKKLRLPNDTAQGAPRPSLKV